MSRRRPPKGADVTADAYVRIRNLSDTSDEGGDDE